MDIKSIKRRLVDLKLAVVGYKTGREPDWLRLEQLALKLARVEASDERALTAIAGEVQSHPKAATEARARLLPHTSSYEGDRAIRLIDAALRGVSVQPVSLEYAELFGQEARLGRMTVREAFSEIASREPEIERIARRLEEGHAASTVRDPEAGWDRAAFVRLTDAQREVREITGPRSGHADPLLRSVIPRNIVYCWLRNIAESPPWTDPDAPYFSRFDTANTYDP